MKTFYLLIALLILGLLPGKAQLDSVIVEKYYITDANDAQYIQPVYDNNGNITDTLRIEEGATTYRVYIKLRPGSKLLKIFGNQDHALRIKSKANFFNQIDYGSSLGYMVKSKNLTLHKSLLALDSWLTIGLAANNEFGVLKNQDLDGSILTTNDYLGNNDIQVGIPLTASDGLSVTSKTISGWNSYPFSKSDDSTVFGSIISGNEYISNKAFIQSSSGIKGTGPDSTNILVAQLTTKSDSIYFDLNIVVLSKANEVLTYVAQKAQNDSVAGFIYSKYLSYPQAITCGCKDPDYLEFNSSFTRHCPDSCKTKIVFGCMDPNSCNYNPKANISVLCCYPGSCYTDISAACPDLGSELHTTVALFPNPVISDLNVNISSNKQQKDATVEIYDSFGKLVKIVSFTLTEGKVQSAINIPDLKGGIYFTRVIIGQNIVSTTFIKN